jgi:hypothetical protein
MAKKSGVRRNAPDHGKRSAQAGRGSTLKAAGKRKKNNSRFKTPFNPVFPTHN